MRIRTVKPEFWRSADTAALDYFTRLLFIGLWNYVDDNGVGEDDVKMIRADLFPRDDVDEISANIHAGLEELSKRGQITRYGDPATGRRYLHVTAWHHQKINRPSLGNKPLPTSRNEVLTEDSLSPHGALTEGSLPRARAREQGTGNREQGNKVSGEGEGAGQLDDDEPRCDEHRNTPHPPKCHACKRVREQREAQNNRRLTNDDKVRGWLSLDVQLPDGPKELP